MNAKTWKCLGALALLALAVALRAGGLWRGLDPAHDYTYHPDEPKQTDALARYLDGRYAVITGNRYCDGYPYGLNRVDELILRGIAPLGRTAWQGALGKSDEGAERPQPGRVALLRWARGLRLLYSLLVLALFAATLRALDLPRAVRPWGILLLALAPVPVSAMHAATGDVGVDLFAALAFWLLALHARSGRSAAWGLAAVAVGWACACKYQGVLAGLALALYVPLAWPPKTPRWPQAWGIRAATAAAGFVVGALSLTPALLIDWDTQWRLIRNCSRLIQSYDAGPGFAALSPLAQVWTSLCRNLPFVMSGLGWTVGLLAVAGLAGAVSGWWRVRRDPEPSRRAAAAWPFALAGAALIAVVVSLAAKPEVQLFHFSWLQAPLLLAAALGLAAVARRSRLLAAGLAVLAAVELGAGARRELFFWSRVDTADLVGRGPALLFATDFERRTPASRAFSVSLEDGELAPFRNRDHEAAWPDGRFWSRQRGLPLPSVPAPIDSAWLFTEAPLAPRNLRQVVVPAGGRAERQVVWTNRPVMLRVGVRAGAVPARVSLRSGSARAEATLMPHRHAVLTLPVRAWDSSSPTVPSRTAWLAELAAQSRPGAAVIEVLPDTQSEADFALWSGAAPDGRPPAGAAARLEALLGYSNAWRCIESPPSGRWSVRMGSDSPTTLTPDPLWLPAGRYTVRLTVRPRPPAGAGAPAEVRGRLILADDYPPESTRWIGEFAAPAGPPAEVILPMTKPLAPYGARLLAYGLDGKMDILAWRIDPDLEALLGDLLRWQESGERPPWSPPPPAAVSGADEPAAIAWEPGIALTRLHMPASAAGDAPLRFELAARLARPPDGSDRDRYLFVHGFDTGGTRRLVFHLPLVRALGNAEHELAPGEWNSEGAPPGDYDLYLGLFRADSRLQDPVASASTGPVDPRRNRVAIGRLRIAGDDEP